MEEVKEGLAVILPIKGNQVFYNPAQVFNRDMSVLLLSVYSKLKRGGQAPGALTILEGLSASGLRSIRYSKEIKGVSNIVANDLDPNAVEHIKKNLELNNVPPTLVEPMNSDVIAHLYSSRISRPYDVIDLDPYGSASQFLDSAVQCARDGGLLCITSTDSAVLCGNHTDTCFTRYGGVALKAGYMHEASVRLLLNAVASAAARYRRAIVPLASFSIDFYVRVFVEIRDSPADASLLATKTMVVYQCCSCEWFVTAPLGVKDGPFNVVKPGSLNAPSQCPECGSRIKIGGPMWGDRLYKESFLEAASLECEADNQAKYPGITSWTKIRGLILAQLDELPDVPLFYTLPRLQCVVRCVNCPLQKWKNVLMSLGLSVSVFL
jgi:tRNA (guanine26-N2/guanine27-N2)-dimethyltransferase